MAADLTSRWTVSEEVPRDNDLLRRSLTLTPGDVEALRNAGLTDREIAELALRSAFARARLGRHDRPASGAGGESQAPETQGDAP